MPSILIIEDEAVIRGALKRMLERAGHHVAEAESVEQAEADAALTDYQLIISDLRLPGVPGTAVIERAPGVPVLIMTSYGSVASAVEAIKLGAVDYITKPFDHEELLLLVGRTLRERARERQQAALKSDVEQTYPVAGMIGRCPAMVDLCARIKKIAPTDATVLILGESGTGKELVARALHEKGMGTDSPFVAFNCAAVPERQIETELFGGAEQDRNGGLLERAEGGTLFLDEIGELPPGAQARLLRLLQTDAPRDASGAVPRPPVRLISATHRDIRQLVQQQAFRSDLYFRLRVVEMTVPPLRERGEDVIELAYFFLDKTRKRLNQPAMELTRAAIEAIRRYNWPGNVRELANAMERAVILCDGKEITPDLLAIDHPVTGASTEVADKLSLEEYFRRFVLEHQHQMTETELAERLGISRKALWERRQRFGIPRPRKNAR